ncbi:hypothetical protein F4677DRAFT_347494 [Hypoxylon crocopeplum]|nr:hypothetical protein F4677DRAFT_347494 [Hypoxylon crocopeplum]
MTENLKAQANHHEGSEAPAKLVRGGSPIQTQLIDSRHVRDSMHLVLLLNDQYGDGNYEVEMRHNYFTIRAPGTLQWNQVYARCH